MKRIITFITFPFVWCLDRIDVYYSKQTAQVEANRAKHIRDSYNVKYCNGQLWITHNGICVIPCENSWTIDELRFELNRVITNSQNCYLNNGKETV